MAFYDGTWAGGIYYTRNVAFMLTQNDYIAINFDIYIYTYSEYTREYDDIKGVKLLIAQRSSGLCSRVFRKIARFLTLRKFDYIYPISSRILSSQAISWIPDFQHNHCPEFFSDEELRKRTRRFTRIAKSKAPLILSSYDALSDFQKYYPPKRNVYVMPFISYLEPLIRRISSEQEKNILQRFELLNTKYVCIMNQFWQHKNHKVVLEAIHQLAFAFKSYNPSDSLATSTSTSSTSSMPSDLCFVFTGRMDDYRNSAYIDELQKIFNDPLTAQHTKLLGFIDREEQIIVMKNAQFIIQPSLFEGWGTVVEDAKVLDKTILLSDIPVHREQINEKCILFDPHNSHALAELILEESKKEHRDNIEKGCVNMYTHAKEYSKSFERLLRDCEEL